MFNKYRHPSHLKSERIAVFNLREALGSTRSRLSLVVLETQLPKDFELNEIEFSDSMSDSDIV